MLAPYLIHLTPPTHPHRSARCLLNRHGEDVDQAIASGRWVCPACRGGCGPGCSSCCNCGPCRKAAGLGPTRQLIATARSCGFTSVHDYLIHLKTGEGPAEIAGRKASHSWGRWLEGESAADVTEEQPGPAEAAETAASASSPQAAAPTCVLPNKLTSMFTSTKVGLSWWRG